MSRLATGILGAIAVSLACGAVQLASGRDLADTLQDRWQELRWQELQGTSAAVNRATKADRATGVTASSGVPASAIETRTISLRLDGLADTSVLVRIPVANQPGAKPAKEAAKEARDSPSPSQTNPGERKATVACEPVVSVLVEIAKQLQPGRCFT
jgi:hypothetical protein